MPYANVTPRIRLPRHVRQTFTYTIPEATAVVPGSIVIVPFRRRLVLGIVESVVLQTNIKSKLQPITQVLPYHALSSTQQWLREALVRFYASTPTLAAITIVPDLARRPGRLSQQTQKIKFSTNKNGKNGLPLPQSAIITGVLPDPADAFATARVCSAIRSKQQTLILLPDADELALVKNTYSKFCRAEVWHGSLSRTENARIYEQVANGVIDVIIGTRSALFLPFHALGSMLLYYPTADGHRSWDLQPHYDATILAHSLAVAMQIPFMVSSATAPTALVNDLPVAHRKKLLQSHIVIADRGAIAKQERQQPLDSHLLEYCTERAKQPALLIVPRRGFATPICRTCDFIPRCSQCDHRLSFADASLQQLRCPLCYRLTPATSTCPTCNGVDFRMIGMGVERVANWLRKQVPATAITLLTPPALPKMQRNELGGIYVATPFIVPHLYALPRFCTIIALRADSYLATPHWFSNEASFHLLSTLAAATGNTLVIDTAEPQHYIYKALEHQDDLIFYRAERSDRKRFSYPPFGEVVTITFKVITAEMIERIQAAIPAAHCTRSATRIVLRAPKGTDFSSLWPSLPDDAVVDHNAPALL